MPRIHRVVDNSKLSELTLILLIKTAVQPEEPAAPRLTGNEGNFATGLDGSCDRFCRFFDAAAGFGQHAGPL
jgi:hypothetical protein